MTFTQPVVTKLTRTEQYFVKNFNTHFNENPISGLVADMLQADKGGDVKTNGRGFEQGVVFTLSVLPKNNLLPATLCPPHLFQSCNNSDASHVLGL
jgi:hypothetical protein